MKEELQTKLVEILGSIQTAAGKAGDFAMTQLPDIAQSYVAYGRAYTTFALLLAVALLVLTVFMVCHARRVWNVGEAEYKEKHPKNEHRILYRDSYPMGLPYFAVAAVSGFIGFSMFAANAGTAMLVWFAPKVWLLKEIAGLIK